jgi:YidC/Oxa1 family membrane protein insertase
MKALKPYTKEINEKFAKNEEAKTRAISKLYEDAKQNPLSGCLVSLVQLPIFLGLYRGVRLLAIDGKLEEPFLWIPSLEGPVSAPDYRGLDWLTSGWVDNVPPLGWETTLAFVVMPVILVLLQSVTMQALQPPPDDTMGGEERETLERTQTILKFLPLLIGFFALQVPAGLTIYWFSSNIFTLSQSLAVKAYFAANPPKIELPDYWDSALSGEADNLTPEERRKASEAGLSVGPTFNELIDQAKFHVYVDRTKSMRIESEAWERAMRTNAKSIPVELEDWVRKSSTGSADHKQITSSASSTAVPSVQIEATNSVQTTMGSSTRV